MYTYVRKNSDRLVVPGYLQIPTEFSITTIGKRLVRFASVHCVYEQFQQHCLVLGILLLLEPCHLYELPWNSIQVDRRCLRSIFANEWHDKVRLISEKKLAAVLMKYMLCYLLVFVTVLTNNNCQGEAFMMILNS